MQICWGCDWILVEEWTAERARKVAPIINLVFSLYPPLVLVLNNDKASASLQKMTCKLAGKVQHEDGKICVTVFSLKQFTYVGCLSGFCSYSVDKYQQEEQFKLLHALNYLAMGLLLNISPSLLVSSAEMPFGFGSCKP